MSETTQPTQPIQSDVETGSQSPKTFQQIQSQPYTQIAQQVESSLQNQTIEPQNCTDMFRHPDYQHFLVEYRGDILGETSKYSYLCAAILNDKYAVIAIKPSDLSRLQKDIPSVIFIKFRTMNVLQQISYLDASNISNIKINPYLSLNGRGVLVGIVDTGIDYLNKEFIKEDDTTRIVSLWDQSLPTDISKNVYIGSTFSREDINSAITLSKQGGDPYSIVPSRDENGHGTHIASIVGARGYDRSIEGVANDCEFVIVKLFPSPNFTKINADNGINGVLIYTPTEIVAGIEYISRIANSQGRPAVIILSTGSTEESHDGNIIFTRYLNSISSSRSTAIVCGFGNQGTSNGHVSGILNNLGETKTSELSISREMKSLRFRVWIRKPAKAAINVISPSGQNSQFIIPKIRVYRTIKYIKENTTLYLSIVTPEAVTGNQMMVLDFADMKPGIWQIQIRSQHDDSFRYDIWLPPKETLPEGTQFLNPDPYVTFTVPAASRVPISVSYYDQTLNAVVSESGKGFTLEDIIKPDLTAPGINLKVTSPGGQTTFVSGSSCASAVVAGAMALLFQWGIVDKNDITMNAIMAKSYLLYGTSKRSIDSYPNRDWGWGKLDLEGTFNFISGNRGYATFSDYIEYFNKNLFIRIPKELGDDVYES